MQGISRDLLNNVETVVFPQPDFPEIAMRRLFCFIVYSLSIFTYYSTFFTCSLISSTAVFIAMTEGVIYFIYCFAPIVFASLIISWQIKSNLRPTAPSLANSSSKRDI